MTRGTLRDPLSRVKPVAAGDPLWFKDAIIYQLGVTAIRLPPFFP